MNARLMQAQREEMAAVQLVLARARAADQHAERLALLREEAERRRAGAPSSEIPPVDVRSPPRASAAADATVSRLQVEMTNLRARMAAPSREDRAEEQAAADSVAKILKALPVGFINKYAGHREHAGAGRGVDGLRRPKPCRH